MYRLAKTRTRIFIAVLLEITRMDKMDKGVNSDIFIHLNTVQQCGWISLLNKRSQTQEFISYYSVYLRFKSKQN